MTILFYPGKANMVTDTLSQKLTSMGILVHLLTQGRPLVSEVQSLANQMVRLDILIPEHVLAFVEARSFLIEQI